jgi:hypothetical protein
MIGAARTTVRDLAGNHVLHFTSATPMAYTNINGEPES